MNYSEYFPIEEYYKRVIQPYGKNYKIVYSGNRPMMVCPFHNDHDPSLGIIKKKSGEEICHCFGCNYWGNIIKLHQNTVKQFQKRYVDAEEARLELCNLFGVSPDKLPKDDTEYIEDMGIRQEHELVRAIEGFDIGDFKYMVAEGKRQGKGIGYFNTLLMIMVSEVKEGE